MSKFATAINAGFTGRMRAEQAATRLLPNVEVSEAWRTIEIERAKEYRIGVRLECTAYVTDAEASYGFGALDAVVRRAKRSIIESVFGEFRAPIYATIAAIDRRDFDDAHAKLESLLHQMFSADEEGA